VDTSEGAAYYVAVKGSGVSGVAVFGTSDPPRQADPRLIAAANSTASQLSDLGPTPRRTRLPAHFSSTTAGRQQLRHVSRFYSR
jgi:hypothetical protein